MPDAIACNMIPTCETVKEYQKYDFNYKYYLYHISDKGRTHR